MTEIPREVRFMGAVTALTMHEMQNVLAIIRESAGLIGDILRVNAGVQFKHRPNMERTLEHITSNVERGKGLLEATSRLAHSPDDDLVESCDLAIYIRSVALLSERLARLRGAAVSFTPPSSPMPTAVGALSVLMIGYQAVQWAVGPSTKNGTVRLELERGKDFHVLTVEGPSDAVQDPAGLDPIRALLPPGRLERDAARLRVFFPVQR